MFLKDRKKKKGYEYELSYVKISSKVVTSESFIRSIIQIYCEKFNLKSTMQYESTSRISWKQTRLIQINLTT